MAEFKPKVWMRCPLCEKQSPMPDPDVREWVGLSSVDFNDFNPLFAAEAAARWAEAKLKENNGG